MSRDLRQMRSEELEEEERGCVLPWWAFCPERRPPDLRDKGLDSARDQRGASR